MFWKKVLVLCLHHWVIIDCGSVYLNLKSEQYESSTEDVFDDFKNPIEINSETMEVILDGNDMESSGSDYLFDIGKEFDTGTDGSGVRSIETGEDILMIDEVLTGFILLKDSIEIESATENYGTDKFTTRESDESGQYSTEPVISLQFNDDEDSFIGFEEASGSSSRNSDVADMLHLF